MCNFVGCLFALWYAHSKVYSEYTNGKKKVLNGELIGKEEALFLAEEAPLNELTEAANEIRKHFCKNKFDICTIINGKSGKCSENCKFCAQSSFYHTKINEYSSERADISISPRLKL